MSLSYHITSNKWGFVYIYIRICLEGDAPQDFLLVQLDPIKWFTTSIYLNPSYVTLYQVFLVSGALQVGILSPESHILIVAGPHLPTYGGLVHHVYSLLGVHPL